MTSEDASGDARPEPTHALPPGAPPAARFATRALAAGASPERLCTLLKADAAELAKQFRTAARLAGCRPPPPGADEGSVRAALAPLLTAELAAAGDRRPTTRCPHDDVLEALSDGRLDGPLLLAQIDHLADCRTCLATVLGGRPQVGGERTRAAPPARRGGCAPMVVSVIALTAWALWRAGA
jgi:hypothetical protein